MSTRAVPSITPTPSDIRLARALVADAQKRGTRESEHIERIARMETLDEQGSPEPRLRNSGVS